MNLDFPFHFDERGRTASTNLHDHVRDMIELLLFTDTGERVNRPEFGSGLRQLVFAPNSPELAAAVQFSVQAALQRWLGDLVELDELEATSEEAQLRLVIRYRVRDEGSPATLEFTRTV
jgi:phage baseplate assembly protein W